MRRNDINIRGSVTKQYPFTLNAVRKENMLVGKAAGGEAANINDPSMHGWWDFLKGRFAHAWALLTMHFFLNNFLNKKEKNMDKKWKVSRGDKVSIRTQRGNCITGLTFEVVDINQTGDIVYCYRLVPSETSKGLELIVKEHNFYYDELVQALNAVFKTDQWWYRRVEHEGVIELPVDILVPVLETLVKCYDEGLNFKK